MGEVSLSSKDAMVAWRTSIERRGPGAEVDTHSLILTPLRDIVAWRSSRDKVEPKGRRQRRRRWSASVPSRSHSAQD